MIKKAVSLIEELNYSNVLVGGSVGAGKTTFLCEMIDNIIGKYEKNEAKIILIDPKMTAFFEYKNEMSARGGLIITDSKEAIDIILNIENAKDEKLFVIVDEYAELSYFAENQNKKTELENKLGWLSTKENVHLIIATQCASSTEVINDKLKSFFPVKMSFRLPEKEDSIAFLGKSGAESLKRGEMIIAQ